MADYTQPDVVPKRVRFFDGQFLQDQDFIDEQRFHLDRERRQSRLLRLTGIGAGLTVTADGSYQVTVARGMAVDALGRQLVLAADTPLPLGEAFANRQGIEVHLAYQEVATDVAQTGGESARRWDESPKIVVVAQDGTTVVVPDTATPDVDEHAVLLAHLAVADNGDVTVDAAAAHRSSLSVSGALGIGTADPGSALQIGDFDPRDRHLTFTTAGGNAHRSGVRLWSESDHQGFSLEYDQRLAAGPGLHLRTHQGDPDGTTRLFVGANGDLGVGTTAPANDGSWGRVVDVLGAGSTRLSVRTGSVDGGVLAHDGGVFGAPAGMVVGTATSSPLSLVTNRASRLTIDADGEITLGAEPFTARWTTKHASGADPAGPYLRLHRTDTSSGGKLLFLELFQSPGGSNLPDVHPSIRFHHYGRFWHRIEGRPDGLHVMHGSMAIDQHKGLWADDVHAGSLTIGSVTIGERELQILQKLAAGELQVDIFSPRLNRYAYAANRKLGEDHADSFDRNYLFALPDPSADFRRWVLRAPE